jgi:hypothetical protein
MLGYGNSPTRFRYGMQRFGDLIAPPCCYGDRAATAPPMPSPHLERKLKEALGDDAGAELAAVTDRIDPIRGDIAELRHTVERGFAALEAKMDAKIEGSAKEQTRFFFLAWGVLLAAIVGLYGTVVALLR